MYFRCCSLFFSLFLFSVNFLVVLFNDQISSALSFSLWQIDGQHHPKYTVCWYEIQYFSAQNVWHILSVSILNTCVRWTTFSLCAAIKNFICFFILSSLYVYVEMDSSFTCFTSSRSSISTSFILNIFFSRVSLFFHSQFDKRIETNVFLLIH